MPIVQVVLFGFAIRTDVKHVRLAIVDPAPDTATLALRHRFASTTDTFERGRGRVATADLEPLFQRGRRAGGRRVRARLCRPTSGSGLPARLLLVADATEPNTGSADPGLRARRSSTPLNASAERGRGGRGSSRRVQMRFNPTRESSNLFVPGLMAFVLTIVSSLMTAISLTREKETGTMEALLVSPLRPWQIIVGKVRRTWASGSSA